MSEIRKKWIVKSILTSIVEADSVDQCKDIVMDYLAKMNFPCLPPFELEELNINMEVTEKELSLE